MARDKKKPRCSIKGCRRAATKWDGGIPTYVANKPLGKLVKLPAQYRCDKHDTHNKWFHLDEKEAQ